MDQTPKNNTTTNTPPLQTNPTPIVATTQSHLDILDIREDFLILKNGITSIILETTAVNFYLLSDVEQEAKIVAFSGLLNSLNFYIEIMIHTHKVNIDKYVKVLEEYHEKASDETRKHQIQIYMEFIKKLIEKNNVLDKRFFIVIPYTSGVTLKKSSVKSLISSEEIPIDIAQTIDRAKSQLIPKKDVMIKLLAGMGLKARQLNSLEITKLFYQLYNEDTVNLQHLHSLTEK